MRSAAEHTVAERSDSERTEYYYKDCFRRADRQVLRTGFGTAAVRVVRTGPEAERIVEPEVVLGVVLVAALSVAVFGTAALRSAQAHFVEVRLVVVHSVEQHFDTDRIRWTGLSVRY